MGGRQTGLTSECNLRLICDRNECCDTIRLSTVKSIRSRSKVDKTDKVESGRDNAVQLFLFQSNSSYEHTYFYMFTKYDIREMNGI